ncbi:unnamed protein product, partial [Protopolystoma xenopodis]
HSIPCKEQGAATITTTVGGTGGGKRSRAGTVPGGTLKTRSYGGNNIKDASGQTSNAVSPQVLPAEPGVSSLAPIYLDQLTCSSSSDQALTSGTHKDEVPYSMGSSIRKEEDKIVSPASGRLDVTELMCSDPPPLGVPHFIFTTSVIANLMASKHACPSFAVKQMSQQDVSKAVKLKSSTDLGLNKESENQIKGSEDSPETFSMFSQLLSYFPSLETVLDFAGRGPKGPLIPDPVTLSLVRLVDAAKNENRLAPSQEAGTKTRINGLEEAAGEALLSRPISETESEALELLKHFIFVAPPDSRPDSSSPFFPPFLHSQQVYNLAGSEEDTRVSYISLSHF